MHILNVLTRVLLMLSYSLKSQHDEYSTIPLKLFFLLFCGGLWDLFCGLTSRKGPLDGQKQTFCIYKGICLAGAICRTRLTE